MAVADQRDDDGSGGKVHTMNDGQKVDFISAIEALADKKSSETLWQEIASACAKCGDIVAYDELKKAMAAKVKELNAKGAK
jgi:hypothetical protein